MVKKIIKNMQGIVFIVLIFILLLISGCSDNNENTNYNIKYETNTYLTGYLDYKEDYSVYFKETNSSRKFILKDCDNSYSLKFKEEISLYGFFVNENGNDYFYCGEYNSKKENLEKEYSKLLINVTNLTGIQKELIENITNLSIQINNANKTLNYMNSEIYFLEDNYTMSQIKKEFRKLIKYDEPKIPKDLIQTFFRVKEPKDILPNCGTAKSCDKYIDVYYDISKINTSYRIYFYGNRTGNSDFYIGYSLEVERAE